MFYTVYKITNLINGNIYVGCHQTQNLDDGYMGSGKLIKLAHVKYGIDNFKKEILDIFDNSDDMFAREKELVDDVFTKRRDTYNLKEGGKNWDYKYALKGRIIANANGAQEKAMAAQKKCREENPQWEKNRIKKFKETIDIKYPDRNIFRTRCGIANTDEVKKKIGEANSKHQQGEGNSHFGTVWVTNLKERISYRIKKNDLENELTNGDVKIGRIQDFDCYFEKINDIIKKEENKSQKKKEKEHLVNEFLKIKQDNNFSSMRELHLYLTQNQLYAFGEESLRRFIKSNT